MGGDTPLSGLSFDIVLEIFPNSSLWWELAANTVNWVFTNLYGMTFGVLFGAAALTILSLVKRRSFKNGFANSALGAVIGAPLGVCVNCAAPIALGLHAGRMRLETTLSALLASPTLNVIVVTMSFALLPFHLALTKLVLALVLVLLVVPLICRWVLIDETESTKGEIAPLARITEAKGLTAWIAKALMPVDADPRPHNFGEALWWFIRTYSRNFFFVFIITVPMMFLAAILGAVVATFTAPSELSNILPAKGIIAIILAMGLVAVIASFVPAPIALDVILTVILVGIGLSDQYAMTILIALGSFSIYAFIILWKAISLKTGLTIWAAVVAMSVTGGAIVHLSAPFANRYYQAQQLAALNAVDAIEFPQAKVLPAGKTQAELKTILDQQALRATPLEATSETNGNARITVTQLINRQPSTFSQSDGPAFKRITGTEIGLLEEGILTPAKEFGYHTKGGGLAAGDIHGDGWVDIVTRRPTMSNGLSLYTNIGGTFQLQDLDLGPVNESEVFHVSLADLDGDAKLDLLVSTIRNGEYIFYNEGGDFSTANMVQLYEPEQAVLASVAFADLDADGDLDVVAGKWAPRGVSIGWGLEAPHTRNQIYWNEGSRSFRRELLPNSIGQTLTLLTSDFDGDRVLDILDGDDAGGTDAITFMEKDGTFRSRERNSQTFPYYLNSSMSYTQGDFDNDLRLDYYGAQIAEDDDGQNRDADNRSLFEICKQLGADIGWNLDETRACAAELLSIDAIRGTKANAASCSGPSTSRDRAICGGLELIRGLANRKRTLEPDTERFKTCVSYFDHAPFLKPYCDSLKMPVNKRSSKAERAEIFGEAVLNANILITTDENGAFVDKADELGVRKPGWSWNSRFTDLDQDGFQDLLIMTGIWQRSASSATNVFYRNRGGAFVDATKDFGFYDVLPSYSYVQLDFDRDGDIDVIRDNMSLRMMVHRNDRPAGPALWVNLRDQIGNSMGVGARVTICTDGQQTVLPGKCQMRMINASGGYMSTDPIAAHFGLGKAKSVSLIEVRWADGETSRIKPESLLGGEIRIDRRLNK